MWEVIIICGVVGLLLGAVAGFWAAKMTPVRTTGVQGDGTRAVQLPAAKSLPYLAVCAVVTGAIFAGFAAAVLWGQVQESADVTLDDSATTQRLCFQLAIIWLLIVATVTDLRDYVIPDQITLPGTILGLAGLTILGNAYLTPLWVDWYNPLPVPAPPKVIAIAASNPHLHGFLVSLCGLLMGAGVVWLIRLVASRMLGQEAMGFGDVTLMAMAGSFLGWQPVLLAIAIAPMCGMVIVLLSTLLTGRSYVAFGPYLAMGCVVTLFCWKYVWVTPIRDLMGDAIGLLMLGGLAAGVGVLLLFGLRGYRAIPVQKRERKTAEKSDT
ncbi:prepilin peptidase [Calycomorphotria hydatis]|nr:A24 family peptidase [Calycomorphotria hydatis]